MKDFVEIVLSFQTAILCVTAFMAVTIGRMVGIRLSKLHNKKIDLFVKWFGTMWLPLWPLVIGSLLTINQGVHLHPKLAELGLFPRMMFGAFCGMISTGIITQIQHMLAKLGVDINIPGVLSKKNATVTPEKAEPSNPPPSSSA